MRHTFGSTEVEPEGLYLLLHTTTPSLSPNYNPGIHHMDDASGLVFSVGTARQKAATIPWQLCHYVVNPSDMRNRGLHRMHAEMGELPMESCCCHTVLVGPVTHAGFPETPIPVAAQAPSAALQPSTVLQTQGAVASNLLQASTPA